VAAGTEAPFFAFLCFGFFTCCSVGGEYELTELDPPCANAGVAPAASDTAIHISDSFFIRFSPGRLPVRGRAFFADAFGVTNAAAVYKAENWIAGNIQSLRADIVGAQLQLKQRRQRALRIRL
jgi:hypothetical protein